MQKKQIHRHIDFSVRKIQVFKTFCDIKIPEQKNDSIIPLFIQIIEIFIKL